MAWGLEARVPFLDKAFMDVSMGVRPEDKLFSKGTSQELDEDGRPKMEKYILRKAFDVAPDGKVCRVTRITCEPLRLNRVTAIPSSIDFVETKGAVLRWRWLLLDRWVRLPDTQISNLRLI